MGVLSERPCDMVR